MNSILDFQTEQNNQQSDKLVIQCFTIARADGQRWSFTSSSSLRLFQQLTDFLTPEDMRLDDSLEFPSDQVSELAKQLWCGQVIYLPNQQILVLPGHRDVFSVGLDW